MGLAAGVRLSTTSRVPESYQLLTDALRFRDRASLRAPALARATGGVSRPVLTVAGRAGLTSSAGEASTQSIIQNLGRRLHMDRIRVPSPFSAGAPSQTSTAPGAALSVTGCNHSRFCGWFHPSTPRHKSARAPRLCARLACSFWSPQLPCTSPLVAVPAVRLRGCAPPIRSPQLPCTSPLVAVPAVRLRGCAPPIPTPIGRARPV